MFFINDWHLLCKNCQCLRQNKVNTLRNKWVLRVWLSTKLGWMNWSKSVDRFAKAFLLEYFPLLAIYNSLTEKFFVLIKREYFPVPSSLHSLPFRQYLNRLMAVKHWRTLYLMWTSVSHFCTLGGNIYIGVDWNVSSKIDFYAIFVAVAYGTLHVLYSA